MVATRYFLGAIAVLYALHPGSAAAEWICWSDHHDDRIRCAQPDGSQVTDLYVNLGKPLGMALDTVNGRLYWADGETDQVVVVDLVDFASPTALVQLPFASGLRGMGIAPSIGKVYWVAEDLQKLQRANLDGSAVEDLAIPPGSFFDVAIDETNSALFWIDGDQIWRSDLDGANRVAIISDADQPYYAALDVAAGKIYWTNFAANSIGRANLDGSERDVPGVVSGLASRPIGIALDLPRGKMYWTLESGEIQRANLDGTGVETVLSTASGTWDISILDSIPNTHAVPAATTWGLVILTLMILSAGSIVLGSRKGGRPCER